MRELFGKGCLCLIALVFGVFIGTRLYWVAGMPDWVAHLASILVTVAIALSVERKQN